MTLAAEDAAKLSEILLETGEPAPDLKLHGTAGGDRDRLRGLPAIGRGVSGAVRDSDPLGALLRKESARRR